MPAPTITRERFRRELLPSPRMFWEQELGRLTRPNSKGWALGRCPFHASKSGRSFSANLKTGAFRCFGCGAHGGDVVAFVRLRDRCDFVTATKKLGAWRDMSPADRRSIDEQRRREEQEKAARAQVEAEQKRERLNLRDQIHTTARIYRETSERLSVLREGATPTSDGEEEACWAVLALASQSLRLTEPEYMRMCGLEAQYE